MIKRVICCIICFCLFFTFIACKDTSEPKEPEKTTTAVTTTDEDISDSDGSSGSSGSQISKPKPQNKSGTIKLGLSAPLTGPATVYGKSIFNSVHLAVDEINAKGGVNGLELEVMILDDQHNTEKIESNYSTLKEWGMQVSLGAATSNPCRAFKTLAKIDNLFFMTPTAGSDDVVEFDNAYQMCFSDGNQGTPAAEFFNENYQGKKIGIFYKADDVYSKTIYDSFKESLDPSFDVTEASFTGDTFTFDSQIALLKDCEVVFMPIYYTPAFSFMSQSTYISNNITTFFGCDGFDGIESIYSSYITAIPQEICMLSQFDTNAKEGAAAEFIAKYHDKYDETKEPLNQFGALAYDAVYAIYEAMMFAEENGANITSDISASDLCEILKGVFQNESFAFKGITANCSDENSYITWNENGTVSKKAIKYIIKEATL